MASVSPQHIYNKWLPPVVAGSVDVEADRFAKAVAMIKQDSRSSALDTLKWLPIIEMFLKAKSKLASTDVEALVKTGLQIFFNSSDNLYIQTRWANLLGRFLFKYRKVLDIEIDWRLLYDLIRNTHLKRRPYYEGLWLKTSHLESVIYLIEASRCFFSIESPAEIWSKFRSSFADFSHNSALEAAGFLALLFPTKFQKKTESNNTFFNREWLADCFELWSGIPHSHYWDLQWSSLLSRCIKHNVVQLSDWEPYLPELFRHFLNAFDVPVGRAGTRSPIYRRIPSEVKSVFNSRRSPSIASNISKSIVYLLGPSGSTQSHLNIMVDFLEQYCHPSNGGSWTTSLQRWLRSLVFYFLNRLAHEHRKAKADLEGSPNILGIHERQEFVRSVVKLIDRGQYSKDWALMGTSASAASKLSYIEPTIVLPLIVSRFHTALDAITATHQLEAAMKTIALSARALLLLDTTTSEHAPLAEYKSSLSDAMFTTLSKLDANDPPKALPTMQLYCAVLSTVGDFGKEEDLHRKGLPIDWSLWIDEFLNRIFTLLLNLEPSTQATNDAEVENSFLMEDGSFYSCLVRLLFRKVTPELYSQAVKKVSKFVQSNILPGAIEEVGALCSAAIDANPVNGSKQILVPIMNGLISSLSDSPCTGFGGNGSCTSSVDFKVGLSSALETTVKYQLGVLSKAVCNGGIALPHYKSLICSVIEAAFNAPSSKVNDAGNSLLSAVIGSLIVYYPLCSHKLDGQDEWICMKKNKDLSEQYSPTWHIPNDDEIAFANELVDQHLKNPASTLKNICKEGYRASFPGQEKEHLRVLFLRLEGILYGLGTCLPDFKCLPEEALEAQSPLTIVGAVGMTIATSELRMETAEMLHEACEYLLKNRPDDFVLLKMLISVIDLVGNYGSMEYSYYLNSNSAWEDDCKLLSEPPTNYITNRFSNGKLRPSWLLVEKVFIHNVWRASMARYQCFYENMEPLQPPACVFLLCRDLLRLALHSYNGVRSSAARKLEKLLDRWPVLVSECLPALTDSLKDPKATEESVLGSCSLLMTRPLIRHLRQDWSALTSFIMALLGSSHHESVKAQNSINELFFIFNASIGGVPSKTYSDSVGENNKEEYMSYCMMISHVKDLLKGDSITIHWRYNLMAHGILLFLTLPVPYYGKSLDEGNVVKLRQAVAGGFLTNLKSELPALRPLSVVALLLLLEASPLRALKHTGSISMPFEGVHQLQLSGPLAESNIIDVLHDETFGESVVNKLSVDRHLFEEESYIPQQMSDAGLFSLMPTHMREWPHTRSWDTDMEGDQFSPTFAKLFKRLVQEFGHNILVALRHPLKDASSATRDRGKQCIAAEIMAGLLHSDAQCVIQEWDGWIRSLLRDVVLLSKLESVTEWAACVRFAVGGKGRNGNRAPLLRQKILDCISEPLPLQSPSSLAAKQLTLLKAALVEILPAFSSPEEVSFQVRLLTEMMTQIGHPSHQVRKCVGSLLCILLANLLLSSRNSEVIDGEKQMVTKEEMCFQLANYASLATADILTFDQRHCSDSLSDTSDESSSGKRKKESVNRMETILHFSKTALKSGKSDALMGIIVALIIPVLSLQETSEKDLSSLARTVLKLLKWQYFPASSLPKAVSAVVTASNDSDWRIRISALTFMQPFVYRHKFVLSISEMTLLWDSVFHLVSDAQLEVREVAATTLSGMMKASEETLAKPFREKIMYAARAKRAERRARRTKVADTDKDTCSTQSIHGIVLCLAACVLSVPYDMPGWLPEMVCLLAQFALEPWPIRGTVKKSISEFRRTHADTWELQRSEFSEEQLDVLSDLTSSATYFA